MIHIHTKSLILEDKLTLCIRTVVCCLAVSDPYIGSWSIVAFGGGHPVIWMASCLILVQTKMTSQL